MKPVLYLDVDGVLNCLDATVPCVRIHPGTDCEAFVPEGTAERLQRLLRVYEPVWSTAWLGDAHGCFQRHLSLPRAAWPFLSYERFKILSIIPHARGRPWAWIDHSASFELRRLNWFPHYDAFLEGLIIETDPHVGLTDDHVEEMLTWYGNGEVLDATG